MSMQFQSMHFDHNNGEVRQRISWIRDMQIRSSASSASEQEISKQNYIPSRMLKYKGSWKVNTKVLISVAKGFQI